MKLQRPDPGIDVAKSGLHGKAGLFFDAGVFEKGEPSFGIQDLDPYLLFDSRESMLGTLENPTLDLDPATPSTLDVITATRSGVATYTDAAGVIQSADPNTMRVDHVDGVPMILVEPSATNLLPYSEDFESGNWEKVAIGTGSNPIVTPDYALSPDGTQNASRVQFNKGSGNASADLSILRYNISITNGLTVSKSVYLKSKTSDAYDLVLYDSSDASGTNVKKITVTPDWQRFDVYGTASSTSTGISFGLRNINVTGVSNTADVLVWGAQLEEGSVATSYIPTSGSTVTRAADDLVISGSAFDFFNTGGDGTFYAEFTLRDNDAGWYVINGHDLSRRYMYSNATQTSMRSYDGTVPTVDFGFPENNTLHRAALSFNSSEKRGSLNGSAESSVNTHSGTFSTSTSLNIGQSSSGLLQLNGHIKRLIYWPYHSDSL